MIGPYGNSNELALNRRSHSLAWFVNQIRVRKIGYERVSENSTKTQVVSCPASCPVSSGGALLRVTIHTAIGARTAARIVGACHDSAVTVTIATLTIIMATAATFAGGGITRCMCHSRSVFPKRGCVQSHQRSRSELLEKAQRAMIKKTVVGRPGRNAPMNPRPTQIQPNARNTGHRLECDSGGGGASVHPSGRLSVFGSVMSHLVRDSMGCRP